MMPLIKLSYLKLATAGKTVLDIPELTIHEGDLLGIMGPNGAGKSTLLRILSLIEKPSCGEIFYREEKLTLTKVPLSLRRRFSIALQQPLLLDASVYDNIAIGLKFRKESKRLIDEKVALWMARFQISHLAKMNARYLSGGEAQRVSLARAMIIEPEVLFLDEPFAALDFPTKIGLMEDFKEILFNSRTTVVFISHDLMEIQYLTKSLCIIESGKVVDSGSTEELVRKSDGFLKIWKKYGETLQV